MAELDARSDVPHDKEESSSGDGLVSPLFSRSVTTNGDKQLVSLRGELDIASLPGLLDWLIEISGPTDDRRDIAAHLAPAKTSRGSQPRSYFALTFRGPTASKSAETGTAWFRLTIIVSGSWSATSLERASALPRSWPDFDLRFGHTFSKDIRRGRSRLSSRQFDIDTDEHMSMVLVGVGDSESGQLVVANAGHPDPLIISGQTPEYLTTKRGPPLGLGPNRYESVVVHLDPSADVAWPVPTA